MEVILVRHGQTLNNSMHYTKKTGESYSNMRQSDSMLTDLGRLQIEQLGKSLKDKGVPVSKLYASPFTRSLDSAIILQKYFPNAQLVV